MVLAGGDTIASCSIRRMDRQMASTTQYFNDLMYSSLLNGFPGVVAVTLPWSDSVYFASADTCMRFHWTRFHRWLWLIPLWFLAPWSAVLLIMLFIHRPHRISCQSFVRRWTWRFAVLNLVASMCLPAAALLRECQHRGSTVVLAGSPITSIHLLKLPPLR